MNINLTTAAKILFAVVVFATSILLVYIPRKLLSNNGALKHSLRTVRLLDLMNYFALGVFTSTCFVMLVPHVLVSFRAAVAPYAWDDALCYKTVQTVSILGFIFIFFLDKLFEYCQQGSSKRSRDKLIMGLSGLVCDEENCPSNKHNSSKGSKSYLVTFQDEFEEEEEKDYDEDEEMDRDIKELQKNSNPCEIPQATQTVTKDFKEALEDNEEEEGDENDENAKLVDKKGILVKRSDNKNNNRNKTCKKVTFEQNTDQQTQRRRRQNRQRLVVGGQHMDDALKNENHFNIRCFAVLASLCIHSLFEGLTLGLISNLGKIVNFSITVCIHQLVASLSVGVSLNRQRLTAPSFLVCALLFSSSIPVGIILALAIRQFGSSLESRNVVDVGSAALQALTVGSFIYVIFVEVLPSELNTQCDLSLKFLSLVIGFISVTLLSFLLA